MPQSTVLQQVLFSPNAGIFNGMVGYWQPDAVDTVGLTDRSRNLNTLTNNAVVTQGAGPGGGLTYAATFTAASSQYLSIADNASLRLLKGDCTVACWVNMASKPANIMGLLSKYTGGSNQREWQLFWDNAADRFTFQISIDGTATNTLGVGPSAPSTATWYFVVARYLAGASIQIFMGAAGGSLIGPVTTAATSPVTLAGFSSEMAIGRRAGTAATYLDGSMAQALSWQRAISQAEVAYLYNSGAGRDLRRAA